MKLVIEVDMSEMVPMMKGLVNAQYGKFTAMDMFGSKLAKDFDEIKNGNARTPGESQLDIIADWILENAPDYIIGGGAGDVAISIFEEWLEMKSYRVEGEGKPECPQTEYPVSGTVMNPNEKEVLEGLLREANEKIGELYSIIAPVKDINFKELDALAKNWCRASDSRVIKFGEVVDRANEYFNGR